VSEPTYSPRGFAFWEPTPSTYGAPVSVYESSAATAPHLWISIDGECHISGDVVPFNDISGLVRSKGAGSIAAHLTMDQARDVRDKLDAAIHHSEERFS
jgi:hypothetical protein